MSFRDPRKVDTAAVVKGGSLAAHLVRQDGATRFTYEADYTGPPVATSLPVNTKSVVTAGGALPPFFSGLLPEGRRLGAVRNAIKTSADDELSLLLAVGVDTVGDVQVMPAGGEPIAAPTEMPTDLNSVSFQELFDRAVGPDLEDSAALAGAQDKVSGHMLSLPVGYRDAEWILKLNPQAHPHLVENEAFFLQAARDSGIQTAEAHVVHDREGASGLLVKRFDRRPRPAPAEHPSDAVGTHGTFLRLPQEDACQVSGRYPADKYRLTTEEVISGLAAQTGAPIVAARTLLQQFAFAYLTCNGDGHGKNFSILHDGREWQVSPAYDLPSTQPYGDTSMALSIRGKNREDITRRDFLELGTACRVPEKATRTLLDRLLKAAPGWLERLDQLPFDKRKLHRLRRACVYRMERLA